MITRNERTNTYFVRPELVNCTCCERMACRYALQDSRSRSTLSPLGCLVSSSFAVAPAPRGVALADTTPALRSVDSKFAIFACGGAAEVENDADDNLLSGLTVSGISARNGRLGG